MTHSELSAGLNGTLIFVFETLKRKLNQNNTQIIEKLHIGWLDFIAIGNCIHGTLERASYYHRVLYLCCNMKEEMLKISIN